MIGWSGRCELLWDILFSSRGRISERRISFTRSAALASALRENRADEQAMARKIDSNWERFLDLTLATQGVLAE